jgi:hypothetical protein
MPSQRAIELFSIIQFSAIGLSLLVQPLAWSRLFSWLRREGEAGALAYGVILLAFGSLIVAFHRVWFGALTVLTVAGWFELLLGFACLLSPKAGLRVLSILSADRPNVCRVGGAISLLLAAFVFAVLLPGGI